MFGVFLSFGGGEGGNCMIAIEITGPPYGSVVRLLHIILCSSNRGGRKGELSPIPTLDIDLLSMLYVDCSVT